MCDIFVDKFCDIYPDESSLGGKTSGIKGKRGKKLKDRWRGLACKEPSKFFSFFKLQSVFDAKVYLCGAVHQFDEINSSICISLGTWKLNNINFSFHTLVLKENRKRNWDKADLEVKASSHSNTSWLESRRSLLSCWA